MPTTTHDDGGDHAAAGPGTGVNEAAGAKAVRPLDRIERRVLGVLIEKAKTTPDQYPLSLNAVVTGCNQKSNRDPVMNLDEEQVARGLAGLRRCGAAAEVFGNGRLARYRHLGYEWLGVGKEELSILGELLLRGEQSEGDLRGRASRMDPIADLPALRAHLDRLAERGLIVWRSPPGRGRLLTHGLMPAEESQGGRGASSTAAPPEDEPRAAAAVPAAGASAPETLADVERRVAALECTLADALERLAAVERAATGG
jgi:uncharacterized protein YceH (UPF0502 family)